jgi:large subunit ribosomal protein L7/L12
MKDEHGIEPAAAAVAVAGGGGGEAGGAAAAEQTEFDVVLESAGGSKLKVVKEVKTLLGLGLKDAKEMVDGAPATIKSGVDKAEGESMKAALEEAGATVSLK